MKVLAFDIGIKNLAFCVLSSPRYVDAWENCNLIGEPVKQKCSACRLNASFTVDLHHFCKKHIPKSHGVLLELGKKPSNKVLRELVKTHHCESIGTSNTACIQSLATKFALPYTQPKAANASKLSLEEVHDALRIFVSEKWHLFTGCEAVLLENQPAFKNPHMKSVQVLLFAVLREAFLQHGEHPKYHFVHAKKKVEDAKKGDEGYAERKSKSEDRVRKLFEEQGVGPSSFYDMWKGITKKSDLADALCMCVDYTSV